MRGTSSGTAGSSSLGWPTPSGGDDSARIQGWIDASSLAGGDVHLGPGTWRGQAIVIKSNARIDLHGGTLKLNDGANTDLLITEGFAGLVGGSTQAGPSNFGVRNGILDGNRASNASGWALRIYGSRYTLDHLEVQNGASGGVFSRWGTGGTNMEAHWSNFRVHDCGGHGVDFQGPHDSAFANGQVFKNAGNGIRTGGNATSERFTNVHAWGTEQDWAWYLGKVAYLGNCSGEGATSGQVMVGGGGTQIVGGDYYGTGIGAETGIQVGDASNPSVSSVGVTGVYLKKFSNTGAPIRFFDSGGGNKFDVTMDPTVADVTVIAGTALKTDTVRIRSSVDAIAAQSRLSTLEGRQTAAGHTGAPLGPADKGFVTWPFDSAAAISTIPLTAGRREWVRQRLHQDGPVTGVTLNLSAAGSGMTAAYVALIDTAGNRLAVSNDVAALLQAGTGFIDLPFTAPLAGRAGDYFAEVLCVGGTPPTITRGQNTPGGANGRLGNTAAALSTYPSLRSTGTGNTSIPTTTTIASAMQATGTPLWVATY